jgi:hypothetical protein
LGKQCGGNEKERRRRDPLVKNSSSLAANRTLDKAIKSPAEGLLAAITRSET